MVKAESNKKRNTKKNHGIKRGNSKAESNSNPRERRENKRTQKVKQKISFKMKKNKNRKGKGKKRRGTTRQSCQDLICLTNLLQALKVEKDTVRNFLAQEKRVQSKIKLMRK